MKLKDDYWERQFAQYNSVEASPSLKYRTWQPARFAANKSALITIKSYLPSLPKSCMELGAGSAAFSFSLYEEFNCEDINAIDYSDSAKQFGQLAASHMNILLKYKCHDFFDKQIQQLKYDMVLSLGVIEHFGEVKRREFISVCAKFSNKYVLIAIPNQESLIFQSYVKWATKSNNQYKDQHEKYDLYNLLQDINENNYRVLHYDGFQCFLSESAFLNELQFDKKISSVLKEALYKVNPSLAERFPDVDFSVNDIDDMAKAEASLPVDFRLKYAFMNYVLFEV